MVNSSNEIKSEVKKDSLPKYLYKYVSFDMFVNIIQKSCLNFSLVGTWDDFHEYDPLIHFINNNKNKLQNQMTLCQLYKTYCQCWTELSESDAMWRIYSYANKSIRIKVKTDNLLKINNIEIVKVIYTDDIPKLVNECIINNNYTQLYAIKRVAFAHEKEYRLIDLFRFNDTEDIKKHAVALNNYLTKFESIDCDVKNLASEINNSLSLLNLGKYKTIHKDVHVDCINNLIESVMVNPFSPNWYVETVKTYCEINKIVFDGVSQIYTK